MRRYRKLIQRFGHQAWFRWLGPRLLVPLDKWLFARFKGRLVSAGPPIVPLLTLTTTGRRSGRERTVPVIYLEDGERAVLVASNWGRASHPAWSENLLAQPEAVIETGEGRRYVRARLADAEEKRRLWPRLIEIWPAYTTYEQVSGRELRVFLLEPRSRQGPFEGHKSDVS